jgi:signal peptidase I
MDRTVTREKADVITEMLDEALRLKGQAWFRVLSGSMYPLIEINDRVLVRDINPAEVRPGDVVLFKSDGVYVTHRVIQFERKGRRPMVLQKGDASAHASLIAPDSIVGKVTAVEKQGRVLDITAGRGKMLNGFLGMKSCTQYRLAERADRLTERTKDTPGSVSARAFLRIVKKPFSVFQRILVKLCS